MESTFVMIKPNGVSHGLIGEIISRYEKARLCISAIKIKQISTQEAQGFYIEHKGKPFFQSLINFVSSGASVLMVLSGENAITSARTINGATSPDQALPGTIRHNFAPDITHNIVHSSDTPESAQREISYWFKPQDSVSYEPYSFICR